jgi:hypothetical protein
MSAAEKAAAVEESHTPVADGRAAVILVQLQSGGVGLNLQHFNRIVFTGPWWTKALMDQAVGRAVRIGQRDVVMVHHLRLKEESEGALNIDAFMMEKAQQKGSWCAEVLAKSCQAVKLSELSL